MTTLAVLLGLVYLAFVYRSVINQIETDERIASWRHLETIRRAKKARARVYPGEWS